MSHLGPHPTFGAGVLGVVVAAKESGLLRRALDRPSTAEEHAAALGCHPRATRLVLEALTALGVLEEHEGIYRRVSDALSRLEPWPRLLTFLRTGETETYIDDPKQRGPMYAKVVMGLEQRGHYAAARLAEALPPAARILDVGAGSAVWSAAMAAEHPGTHVTALDRPEVVAVLEKTLATRGLEGVVRPVVGDYHQALPEGPFDRVVLAGVLHLETEEDAARLVKRASDVLSDDGEIVIVDMVGGGGHSEVMGYAFYGLHLGMRTERGKPHTLDELTSWCREAGLADLALHRAADGFGAGALQARRGAERLVEAGGDEVFDLRTECRTASQELASLRRRQAYLFDGTSDALMVVVHGVNAVVEVNRRFAELFGVDWWPIATPRDYEPLVDEQHRPAFRAMLAELAGGEVSSRRRRFIMRRADGEPFPAEVSCYDPGYRTAALLAIRDLTAQEEAQRRIEEYARKLEATNAELERTQAELVKKEKMAALGALVAGMAHDVNTPFGALKANVDLMADIGHRLADDAGARRDQLLASHADAAAGAAMSLERIEGTIDSLTDYASLDGEALRAVQSEASHGVTRAIAEKIAGD